VVWSCARLGYATERLSSWAVWQLGEGTSFALSSPQVVSNAAWGLARLGHQPQPQLIKAIVDPASTHIYDANTVHSPSSEGFHLIPGFKPKELSALMSALTVWRARPGSAFLHRIEAQISSGRSST